ncbi:MAG: flagellar M-ring protein FliF [Rhodobacteraceae bacterium]|nr:MAG: flagellar M-ring protein FliF [Paracoccaceae bacterium]
MRPSPSWRPPWPGSSEVGLRRAGQSVCREPYALRVKRVVKRKCRKHSLEAQGRERPRRPVGETALGRFASLWSALQPRQRLIATLAFGAILASAIGLVQAIRTPSMVTLYGGLDPATAGEVAQAVEAMGVRVEASGAAVMVPAADRDRVRMALAAAGLPRNGPAGYELLDDLGGFGTSSAMFEAAYWRAKEGELARTILAARGVRSARVHIANPASRPFERGAKPSASVTVSMGSGALDQAQAEAIRFLVSSAVAGLNPTDVTVIDAAYGAVLRPGEAADDAAQRPAGPNREAMLRAEIERLLAARVGVGKAIVSVAVETQSESETLIERLIDPNSRIAISTETRDVEERTSGGPGGGATVASNLPVDGGGAGGGGAVSDRTEAEERINYEISETRRERVRRAGDVKRITVAVLVDGVVATDAGGERVWTPRPAAELDQLRDLVRAAVGYNAERGDVVTVETLEFAERASEGAVAEVGAFDFLSRNGMEIFQIAALAAVALGVALFVVKPLLAAAEAQQPPPGPERLPPPLPGDEFEEYGGAGEPLDHIARLRAMFADQKEDSANVIRSWLERDVQRDVETEAET